MRKWFRLTVVSIGLTVPEMRAFADGFDDLFKRVVKGPTRPAERVPGRVPDRGASGPAAGAEIPPPNARESINRRAAVPAPAISRRDYMVETTDRWKLVIHRYSPADSRTDYPPVILCHGFGLNAKFWELAPEVSFARYLAENGFDVWAVDLRGCGMSHKWALTTRGGADALVGRLADRLVSRDIPKDGYVNLDLRFAKWTFDDHVNYDLPAVLAFVKRTTGAPSVTWVGHSMGGNVALAYLARYGQDDSIGKLVTVGSQLTMPDGQLVVQFFIELLRQREFQLAGRRVEPADAFASANNMFFEQANVRAEIRRTYEEVCQEVPSGGLVRQYLDLCQTGRFLSANRSLDYSSGAGNIRRPYLVAAGSVDQLAPPVVQRFLYDSVGSAEKTLLIFGRRDGFSVDYGHCDSFIGPNARAEIYPRIARWIAAPSRRILEAAR